MISLILTSRKYIQSQRAYQKAAQGSTRVQGGTSRSKRGFLEVRHAHHLHYGDGFMGVPYAGIYQLEHYKMFLCTVC